MNDLYQFQLDDYKNNKHDNDKKIEFYIKYVQHQGSILKGFESHLLTLIATIFLPLSFIVGFFGMNFKSMGAPSLSKGIFNIKHATIPYILGINYNHMYHNMVFLFLFKTTINYAK